jgi:hypothetical protein
MGDQLQPVQVLGSKYSNPKLWIPAAVIGYMIYNKKTRKTVLYALAGFAAYLVYGVSQIGKMTNADRIAMQGPK